ncbi:hypothetical protein NHX12_030887, partial [Muraenolepis orangiensis]
NMVWRKDGFKYLGVFLGKEIVVLKNWEDVTEKIEGKLSKLDVSNSKTPGLTVALCRSKTLCLQQLVDAVGPELSDAQALGSLLGLHSVRVAQRILQLWSQILCPEEKRLLRSYGQGGARPDPADPFPEIYLSPGLGELTGPLLQLIHTISVVDRDEPQSGHHFHFNLVPDASSNRHFTLWDVKDNTAGIRTQRSGFNRNEQNVYFLSILVVDNGAILSCSATAYVMSAALSPGALIALLVCMLILIVGLLQFQSVLVLLILTLKRHRKGQRIAEDEEDMRDNVIKYNDEGGGEQDTQAYDMSALRNLYDFPEAKGPESGPPDLRMLPQYIQGGRQGGGGGSAGGGGRTASASVSAVVGGAASEPPADFSLFKGYIRKKVQQADADLSVPPYDSFQTYAFEGSSSPALSLSSIHTLSTASEQDFSYLGDWGPRFRQLAGYYAPAGPEEDGS